MQKAIIWDRLDLVSALVDAGCDCNNFPPTITKTPLGFREDVNRPLHLACFLGGFICASFVSRSVPIILLGKNLNDTRPTEITIFEDYCPRPAALQPPPCRILPQPTRLTAPAHPQATTYWPYISQIYVATTTAGLINQ